MCKITNAYFLSLTLAFLLTLNAFGQTDKEAIKILDNFSANALGAPSVSMNFNLITTNQAEKTNDTLSGSIVISKDKYWLSLPDNIIWYNGATSWSYLPAEKEVTITRPDKKDNSFQNKPSAIFSMYKNGYKSKLIEERSDVYIIDLYPEDIKSDIIRVRLWINKTALDLNSLEYKRRDGVIITLHVSDYSLKLKADAEMFNYQPSQHKGVEVIDMR